MLFKITRENSVALAFLMKRKEGSRESNSYPRRKSCPSFLSYPGLERTRSLVRINSMRGEPFLGPSPQNEPPQLHQPTIHRGSPTWPGVCHVSMRAAHTRALL